MAPIDSTQLHIDNSTQLFVDSWLIESVHCMTRRWHKPVRHGDAPVLTAEEPWEHFPYFTYSNYCVIHDASDGLYKCWYEDLGPAPQNGTHGFHNRLLYAESRNGVDWHKPDLGIVLHEGRPTNIVAGHDLGHGSSPDNMLPDQGVHSAAIVIDPFPARPEERFRMLFSSCPLQETGPAHVIRCAHSQDGIVWRLYDERPCIGSSGSHLSDVACLWYDHNSREFVMNTRHGRMYKTATPHQHAKSNARWARPYAPHRPDLQNKRRVYQKRSHDFIHWAEPIPIAHPGETWDNLDEMHYGMAQFQVDRHHFGTMGIFHHADDLMDVRMYYSRDGVHWAPTDHAKPFLAPRGPGHWDAHMVSIACQPVAHPDALWFFHGGTNGHHDLWMSGSEGLDHPEAETLYDKGAVQFGMGLARLRRDGFCSLDTGEFRPGALSTRPVLSNGSVLHINARCRNGGEIAVEVTDAAGNVLEGCAHTCCDTFKGDSTDHVVTWKENAAIPGSGDFRRIVFRMKRAELFSFHFE